MSTAIDFNEALTFDMADRLRKALRISGIGVGDMAHYLGVNRNSVTNWINGHNPPSKQTRRLWAIHTGVPLEWLETGVVPPEPCPRSDSNGRLTRYESARNRRSVATGRADRRLMIAA